MLHGEKKTVPDPRVPGDGRLLAEVEAVMGDDALCPAAAKAALPCGAVHPALPRA